MVDSRYALASANVHVLPHSMHFGNSSRLRVLRHISALQCGQSKPMRPQSSSSSTLTYSVPR